MVDPLRAQHAPNWPQAYDGHTIECVWVNAYLTEPNHNSPLAPDATGSEPRTWVFLRDRMGKGANGPAAYQGIMESVQNAITQNDMTPSCEEFRASRIPPVAAEEPLSQAARNRQKMKEKLPFWALYIGIPVAHRAERLYSIGALANRC